MDVNLTKAWSDSRREFLGLSALKCSASVTPSDDTTYDMTRGVAFSADGDLVVEMDDTEVTIASGVLAAGIIHPLAITKVKDGTTAANVTLFW